jgi:hypothetical protein
VGIVGVHKIGFPKPAADGFPLCKNALSRKAGNVIFSVAVRAISLHFLRCAEAARLWDKMAQILFVLPEIKANQGKSSPRAGNFFGTVGGNTDRYTKDPIVTVISLISVSEIEDEDEKEDDPPSFRLRRDKGGIRVEARFCLHKGYRLLDSRSLFYPPMRGGFFVLDLK